MDPSSLPCAQPSIMAATQKRIWPRVTLGAKPTAPWNVQPRADPPPGRDRLGLRPGRTGRPTLKGTAPQPPVDPGERHDPEGSDASGTNPPLLRVRSSQA